METAATAVQLSNRSDMHSTQQCLNVSSSDAILRVVKDVDETISIVNDLRDIVNVTSKPVHQLVREKGKEPIQLFITYCITNYLDFVSHANDMNENQCVETAELIMEEFPHIQLETIKLFFKKMKCGYFGEDYNSMNGAKIISRLHTFYNEVISAIDDAEFTKHQSTKGDTSVVDALREHTFGMPDDVAKRLGIKTDAEKEEDKRVSAIRRRIICENQSLYHSDPDNAEAIINEKIENALISEGIFTQAV